MSFVYSQYMIFAIALLIIWWIINHRQYAKYTKWILDHWFFETSKLIKLSNLLYVIGSAFLIFSALDLRGPEKYVESKTSNQKTMILIDASASMYAEDVRPNRFEKAILLAKHYAKKAVGQKISVAVFSDDQKVIIPFTDDIDLVEARIESLKNLNFRNGGTGLTLAIQQAVQTFKVEDAEPTGNILVFTDSEETDGGITLDIPETISVGMVGIGTRRGGPVPMRNDRGISIGNKKFKGETVVSKLDEDFLKSLGDRIKYYKTWIATSYSLPTEELISFFSRSHQLKMSKNSFRVRPVQAYKLIVPGVMAFFLAFLLRLKNPFVLTLILVLTPLAYAQMPLGIPVPEQDKEDKEPKKSQETLDLEKKLSKGELGDEGRKYLANKLLEDGFSKDAEALYSEVLGESKVNQEDLGHHFNYATAQLKNKNTQKSIEKYKEILDYSEENPSEETKKLETLTKTNLLKAFKRNKGSGKGKNSKEEKDEKSQKGNSENKEGKEGNKKDDKENKSEKDKQEKPKEDKKRNDGDDKKESQEKKDERKKKLPALLKQLINDDNKLQKQMIDAKTSKRKASDQKDW